MLAFVQAVALMGALGYQFNMSRVMTAGVLLGVGLMGNFFGKLRRNFFLGIRVPWTLASERVWNETHRLAAWVTCACGLLGSAVAIAGYPLVGLSLIVRWPPCRSSSRSTAPSNWKLGARFERDRDQIAPVVKRGGVRLKSAASGTGRAPAAPRTP